MTTMEEMSRYDQIIYTVTHWYAAHPRILMISCCGYELHLIYGAKGYEKEMFEVTQELDVEKMSFYEFLHELVFTYYIPNVKTLTVKLPWFEGRILYGKNKTSDENGKRYKQPLFGAKIEDMNKIKDNRDRKERERREYEGMFVPSER